VLATSVRDSLTGCFTRKHALEAFERELHRSSRLKMPLSVVMFDIDRFKEINDRYGHLCGDAALASVGDRLRSALRSSDLMARYGGDEFLLVLPDTPPDGARRAVATIRRELERHPVVCHDNRIPVKASFGITAARPNELDVKSIIERADLALYRAKREGRDRVEVE
jgi:diguanylate cyclase